MFVFYYVVILSFIYLLTHGEGETTCDCPDIGKLNMIMNQLLYEKTVMSARLRNLENRQKTTSHSITPTASNGIIKLPFHQIYYHVICCIINDCT